MHTTDASSAWHGSCRTLHVMTSSAWVASRTCTLRLHTQVCTRVSFVGSCCLHTIRRACQSDRQTNMISFRQTDMIQVRQIKMKPTMQSVGIFEPIRHTWFSECTSHTCKKSRQTHLDNAGACAHFISGRLAALSCSPTSPRMQPSICSRDTANWVSHQLIISSWIPTKPELDIRRLSEMLPHVYVAMLDASKNAHFCSIVSVFAFFTRRFMATAHVFGGQILLSLNTMVVSMICMYVCMYACMYLLLSCQAPFQGSQNASSGKCIRRHCEWLTSTSTVRAWQLPPVTHIQLDLSAIIMPCCLWRVLCAICYTVPINGRCKLRGPRTHLMIE